jgi:hypothetical protein
MVDEDRSLIDSWLDAALRMSAVPTEALRAVPLVEIARAARANRDVDLDESRLVAEHPGFADAAQVVAALEVVAGSPRYSLIVALIERIQKLAPAAAIPVLSRVLVAPDTRYHQGTARALAAIGTAEALEVLAGVLDQPASPTEVDDRVDAAVDAVFKLDPTTAFDRLVKQLEEPGLSTPTGRYAARCALAKKNAVLRKDPRWLDYAVKKLGDIRLSTRDALLAYPKSEMAAALQQVGGAGSGAGPRAHAPPQEPGWLARYQAGAHIAVWDEICALEGAIRDPAVLPEAEAVAREMMKRVRENLERIVAVLDKHGYAFAVGKVKDVLVGPKPKTAAAIADMEKVAGVPLPIALRAFYEAVGEVNLMELPDFDYDEGAELFRDFARFDPLVVVSPKEAIKPLKESRKREDKYPVELRRRLAGAYLGPDPRRKADLNTYQDDDPYVIDVTGAAADGVVERASFSQPFVAYLRTCLEGGGFYALPQLLSEETFAQREALTIAFVPF